MRDRSYDARFVACALCCADGVRRVLAALVVRVGEQCMVHCGNVQGASAVVTVVTVVAREYVMARCCEVVDLRVDLGSFWPRAIYASTLLST